MDRIKLTVEYCLQEGADKLCSCDRKFSHCGIVLRVGVEDEGKKIENLSSMLDTYVTYVAS